MSEGAEREKKVFVDGLTITMELLPPNLTVYSVIKDCIPILAFIAASAYYIFISKNTVRSRKAQLFMNLYSQFRSAEFLKQWSEKFFNWEWEDFDDFQRKYSASVNVEYFAMYNSTCAFFEGVGVLVKNDLIDIQIVDELMSIPIKWMWEKMKPVTDGYRKLYGDPALWEFYEYLYEELKKRE